LSLLKKTSNDGVENIVPRFWA